MATLLTIGEFAQLTHLSVKALRHYDDLGLLEPADVDPSSGYRFYATAQVPTAHLIRRFRELDMPLDDIRTVLDAPDVGARDEAIVSHLARMEARLSETRTTVASLRALLDGRTAPPTIEHRSLPPTHALAVAEDVAWDDAEAWVGAALGELHGAIDAGGFVRTGPDAALYPPPFFQAHQGEVVAYVPVDARRAGDVTGRAEVVVLPAVCVAVLVHDGPFSELDRAYGALGTYVAERVLGADGPIREHYVAAERTEVCWPIRPDA